MSGRKYTHIKLFETEIKEMWAAGKTKREIANALELEKEQVKGYLKRQRRNAAKIAAGIEPKSKGRPRKDGQTPLQNEKTELERLRMENKLLRDFLQLTGRK